MNKENVSDQMTAALGLVDREGPTPLCQMYIRLYDPSRHRNRRVFAASLARTIRRMERHKLVTRQNRMIEITQHGRFTLHPEMEVAMLGEAATKGRELGKQIANEITNSEDFQTLLRSFQSKPMPSDRPKLDGEKPGL